MNHGSPDSQPIEAYALIGDCETAALVGADGSIDWLCWPRFDAPACFAALLGDAGNGRWRIAPAAAKVVTTRSYLGDSLILETRFETAEGAVRLVDFMPPKGSASLDNASHAVRMVFGEAGAVALRMELIVRFGYGATVPWVSRAGEGAWRFIAGPDMAVLRTSVAVRGEAMKTAADFTVKAGEVAAFVLSYGPSWLAPPAAIDAARALANTRAYWSDWVAKGRHPPAARRSLIALKALTYAPTGGVVAAPTTSLPEKLGGVRNWDYRCCWLRDASITLRALMSAGYFDEARAWRDWLHRAVAGDPADMRIMYGVAGERRLPEWEADWLAGYAASRPVRIGNAAHEQFQLDVYGEVMDAFHHARKGGLAEDPQAWAVQRLLVRHVAKVWDRPDDGIWEVRGPRRHFTYSKIIAWVAIDRAVRAVEDFGLEGPEDDWRALRSAIGDDVRQKGFDAARNTFVRAYDDEALDASLLLIADLGFIAADDPRFAGTVAAVERELLAPSGLVMRYDTTRADDGLPPGEGAFLACSFWLVNAYVALGRREEAESLFRRLLALANDVGLLAEEYEADAARLVGNFPQAFSHVGLIDAAFALGRRPLVAGSQGESEDQAHGHAGHGRHAQGDIGLFADHGVDIARHALGAVGGAAVKILGDAPGLVGGVLDRLAHIIHAAVERAARLVRRALRLGGRPIGIHGRVSWGWFEGWFHLQTSRPLSPFRWSPTQHSGRSRGGGPRQFFHQPVVLP